MDPEKLRRLVLAVRAAQERGADTAMINEQIQRATGGSATDPASLATFARQQTQAPERQESAPARQESGGGGLLGHISNTVEAFGHSASFGLSDEIGGLLRGIGAAVVPGGQGFEAGYREGVARARGSLEQARQETPTGTAVGEIAGAVAGPGAVGARFAMRGGGLLARMGRGAAAGAAEGGVYGGGTAEGGVQARSESALEGAKFGAAAGAVAPGAVAGARAVGRGVRAGGRMVRTAGQKARTAGRGLMDLENVEEAERTIGPRLGDEMRQGADIEGRPSRVRAEISEARRGIYGELDEIEEIADPNLGKALQADDVKPFVPDEVAAGKRPPSFVEAQGALRQVRKAKGAAMRSGDAASIKSLGEAEREIGSRLSDAVEGFEDANREYAHHMARARALESGGTVAPKSADEVTEAFEALDSDVERQAFRESLGHWFLKRLDDHTAIPTTLKKIRTAPETRAKLRLLFDDDDAFEAFVSAAEDAERIRDRAKAGRLVERELMRNLARALPWIGGAGLVGAAVAN